MESSSRQAGRRARWLGAAIGAACALAIAAPGAGAQLTTTPTALAPETPDIPPLPARTWTVHVLSDSIGIHPSVIVVEPGQKFTVRFDNRDSGAEDLVFDLPGGPSTFDGPVGVGQTRIATMIAPDRAGVYEIYTSRNPNGSHGGRAQLIVTPTAAGSLAPSYGARDVRIVARDNGFNPSTPFFDPGERVRLTVYNIGDRPHSLTFAFPRGQVSFGSALAPGEMRTMIVNVPARVGQYSFYDPAEGNRDRGAAGSMIVSLPLNPNGPGRVTAAGVPTQTTYPSARPTIAVSGATYHIPSRARAYAHVSRTHVTKRTHAKQHLKHAKHVTHRKTRHAGAARSH